MSAPARPVGGEGAPGPTPAPAAPPPPGAGSGGASIRRYLVVGTATNYAAQILTLGVWFVITPFIVHRLGPTRYGLWALAASFVAYGGLLDFGVSPAVTKYVAEFRARGEMGAASALVATALRLYTGLGALALGLSVPLALLLPDLMNVPAGERATFSWLIAITGAGIGIQLPATTAYAVLRGLQRYDLLNLVTGAATLALAGGIVAVLLLGGGVLGLAAVTTPLALLWQLPMIRLIRREAPDLRLGWRGARRDMLRTVAGFSASLFVVNIAGVIKEKTDEVVIGAALPVARVTPYSIARRVSSLPTILSYQFVRVLMPLASDLHGRRDRARLRELQVASTRLALGLFFAVGTPLMLLAGPLLGAWVGSRYASSARIVLILVGAGMLEMALWPAFSVLQGMGRQRPLALVSGAAAALNLGLSIVLVGRVGVTGVALGTLFAAAVETVVVMPIALAANGVSARAALHGILLPAVVPALAAAPALLALRDVFHPASLPAVGVIGAAGALLYAAVYLAFGVCAQERSVAARILGSAVNRARTTLR